MRKYELIASRQGSILIEADSELLVRKEVDFGWDSKELSEQVIYLEKNDDFGTIFIFNKDKTEIIKKIDNVHCYDYTEWADNFVFSVGTDYFLFDGKTIVSLGSWLEKKVFLQKEGNHVRARYFVEDKLVSKEYKSAVFYPEDNDNPVVFECVESAPEGFPLYEVFSGARGHGFRDFERMNLYTCNPWFKIYCDCDNDVVQIYCRYAETNQFVKVYEGVDKGSYVNAVWFFDEESQLYKLYGSDDAYKFVLWGEGEDLEDDDDFVRIGNRIWKTDDDDDYFLNSEPELIEEEKSEEAENCDSATEADENSTEENDPVSDDDPGFVDVIGSDEPKAPFVKKEGWFSVLKSRLWPW